MTVCNMTIEGGGRAGMIAPDDTTFEWVEGREAAPGSAAARRVARAAHRRGRELRQRGRDRRGRAVAAGHLGHEPRRWSSTSRASCPSRATRARSGRSSTWRSSPARRSRRSSSTASSSARARTRASATCARRPRSSRAAGSRPSVDAMVVPGSPQVKAQAEPEGLDEVFRSAGFDWRSAGCSMCLGMNPDIAVARASACASTSNRNFEGRQGRGGRIAPRQPPDGRRRGDRGPLRRHQGVELSMEPVTRHRGRRLGARPRRRGHRPDHPQAVPQARGAHGLRRVPLLRLGEGARLGPAAQPDPRGGAQLRLRLVARARALGARGLRLQGDRRAELRRHLLLQLHEDRAASGDAARRPRSGR